MSINIEIKKTSTFDHIENQKRKKEELLKSKRVGKRGVPRSLRSLDERDKAVMNELWKADNKARELHSQTGLPFTELRDVARTYIVRIWENWDISKGANFSTFVNRSLEGHMKNWLRDHSRAIRPPRSLHLINIEIQKQKSKKPSISNSEISENTGIPIESISDALAAIRPMSCIYEETTLSSDEVYVKLEKEDLLSKDYNALLQSLIELEEQDFNLLMDMIIKKRVSKTLIRKYKLGSATNLVKKTHEIMEKVFEKTNYSAQNFVPS